MDRFAGFVRLGQQWVLERISTETPAWARLEAMSREAWSTALSDLADAMAAGHGPATRPGTAEGAGTRLAGFLREHGASLADLLTALKAIRTTWIEGCGTRGRQARWRMERFFDSVELSAISGWECDSERERDRAAAALREAESRLAHDAMHDPLTGLPNRTLFLDRVDHCIAVSRRKPAFKFAVLILDLDQFKRINDSLGHAQGDHLLTRVAQRLVRIVRPLDSVARVGGDEFAVLLEDIREDGDATRVCTRAQDALAEPVTIGSLGLVVNTSIGVALSTSGYDKAGDLVRDADIAMYRAKGLGGARYAIFDRDMHARAVEKIAVENDLRKAVERRELLLHYQPIVSVLGGNVCGFEALVRWMHPGRGLVPPLNFIPTAEETGLIVPIGAWVLRESCEQIARWRADGKPGFRPYVCVNLSGRQFGRGRIVEDVKNALRDTGLAPDGLHLEITESTLLVDSPEVRDCLGELRALGIHLLMDDFGTGYSSLGYLTRFPIDTLKIDRSFVSAIGLNSRSEIVRAIVHLGRSLGMDIVAEGVEDEVQLEFLRDLRCDLAQGYYFSRPVDAEQARKILDGGYLC
jgi:diguanylate cyclase (GGDEF)-like protein